MNRSEHLTTNQIAAFSAGSLAVGESREVGGHLIRCGDCRQLLPPPTTNHVWTAVMSEQSLDDGALTTSSASQESSILALVGALGRRNRLAWSGGLLAVLLAFAALFIFTVSNRQNPEIARSFEIEKPIPVLGADEPQPEDANILAPGNSQEKDDGSTENNRTSADRKLSNDGMREPKMASPKGRGTKRVSGNIATTRGAKPNCTTGRTVEVELGSVKTDLILRWKSVPNAAKYHLYISDDNEILVDEFETEKDTSYTLKKQLDPSKSYKWKIVITLESGQTLYVDAQKFTAKDFGSLFTGYKTKAKSNTRCLAN